MNEFPLCEPKKRHDLLSLDHKQKKLLRAEAHFCNWLSELMSKSLGDFLDDTPLPGEVFSVSDELINCFALNTFFIIRTLSSLDICTFELFCKT